MKCRFLMEIIEMKQYGTLEKMLPVRPRRLNGFLHRYQIYMWYQDEIYLAEHRLVVPFQFGTTGRKNFKYPNMIEKKRWKELDKEVQKKGIKLQIPKK